MRMGSTGKYDDRMYALADTAIPADKLKVRPDPLQPDRHAFMEPAITVELGRYESDLSGTRKDWRQVWP